MANEVTHSQVLIGTSRSGGKVKKFTQQEVIDFCKKNKMKHVYEEANSKVSDFNKS